MDVSRKPPCRLEFVFAVQAPVAVVLRRGPTRLVRMVVWNTRTDNFEDGEWWRGRIYAEKSGLSPNGRLFVYFGYQWKPRYIPKGVFAFTAVSHPPTFQPVALWPADSFWGGGGCFLENRRLMLNYGPGAMPDAHPSFRPLGLDVEENPGTYCSPSPDAAFRSNGTHFSGADWGGKDHDGRLVFTRAGILYRLVAKREVVLRDFNADVPPPIDPLNESDTTQLKGRPKNS